jgi:hypothetical protein
MYVMTESLFPARARVSAFRNDTGSCGPINVKVAGFSYTPGKPLEMILGVGTNRYYDVPLRFMGSQGGAQYALPDSHEVPWYTAEPRPRRVTAVRLPFSPAAKGYCYGAITWDKANVSLLVVVLEGGEVVLWPPHKISWTHDPQPFPDWLKRRYADDAPALELTRVREASDEEILEKLAVAKRALCMDLEGWRPHGIGLIQRYMPGPTGPKHYRVHVWTPDAVKIGLESGIHDHRYDLESWVVAGCLTQEEWALSTNPTGMWRLWEHHNDTMEPTPTEHYFDASPRTLDIHSGQAYTFPRNGFHRSVPRSDVVVTVMERKEVTGISHALCPRGHEPINGQTVKLPVESYLKAAKKHLGV